jgi:glycine dehydrogenase subunit 2
MSKSQLSFEKSVAGSNTFTLPPRDIPDVGVRLPADLVRQQPPALPDLPKNEAIRHFTDLSTKAFGVDTGFYPLGSCTMKYNPKINEWATRLPGFAHVHPLQPTETVQGALELMYDLEQRLCAVTGMDRFTLQPAAGAHGELTGAMIIKAYHQQRGDLRRTKMLVPDSAHGTNPATANVVGFSVQEVRSNERGLVDLDALRAAMSDEVAGIMLTNPNTLGLFEEDILEIAQIVHDGGGLLYYDGANLNGMLCVARPGDMGFDIVHLNLHKTFGTPHGGGGPGSGPVGVKGFLAQYLPTPLVGKNEEGYFLETADPHAIGSVMAFYGNFGVLVRAYTYLLALGAEGLREAGENAVLNANYLRMALRDVYHIPFDRICKHEFIATPGSLKDEHGVNTMAIAKRLLDYGYHPPTVYFPLIVEEALMIEPTETESRETLDAFAATMRQIAEEAKTQPDLVQQAPHQAVIKRVDEVSAARKPILRYSVKD